jgi:hypothetical protein
MSMPQGHVERAPAQLKSHAQEWEKTKEAMQRSLLNGKKMEARKCPFSRLLGPIFLPHRVMVVPRPHFPCGLKGRLPLWELVPEKASGAGAPTAGGEVWRPV